MNFPSVNPTNTKAWKKLKLHFSEMKEVHMMDLFDEDESRCNEMKISWDNFQLDYSKNRITKKTLSLLFELAEEVKLKEAITLQFKGDKINKTEDRAVLHTALRDFNSMKPEVKETLQKMKQFSETIFPNIKVMHRA